MTTKNDDVLIKVEGLHKIYGDFHALNGINEEIHKGEVVVVVGPSGSGKSTFLRCLNRLEEPTKGHIYFEGTDITDPKTDIDKHRQKMGMVFQHFNLFPHLTVLDNITLAPTELKIMDKKAAEEKARDLLSRVGLADKADAYPAQLSGGQKQRVAIARSLAMNPDIMLFDEPTSALDPISTTKIEDLMAELKKKYTVVIVTHNMQQAARISDRTAFFLLGEIVEYDATPAMFSMPQDKRTEDYITGRFG